MPPSAQIAGMNPQPGLRVRRATLDDLATLHAMWLSMRLPADELEKQLKEFQVVEDADGNVLGAVGIQLLGQHALLYGEGFSDFSIADSARELFWRRFEALAANHGIFRIWTQETSPFWNHWGFQPATAEILSRLPEKWKASEGRMADAPNQKRGGDHCRARRQTRRLHGCGEKTDRARP